MSLEFLMLINGRPSAGGGGVILQDTFTDTDGTLLPAHVPDVDIVGGGWIAVSGVDSHKIESNSIAPSTSSVNRTKIDLGKNNCILEFDYQTAGLAGPRTFFLLGSDQTQIANNGSRGIEINTTGLFNVVEFIGGSKFTRSTTASSYGSGKYYILCDTSSDVISIYDGSKNLLTTAGGLVGALLGTYLEVTSVFSSGNARFIDSLTVHDTIDIGKV